MNLKQLQNLNTTFQQNALKLSEMIPSSGLNNALSELIRFGKKVDDSFLKLISKVGEPTFYNVLDKLEEQLDEMIFIFDQIDEANDKHNVPAIAEFLKEGYSLVNVYEQCNNSIIEQKLTKEDFTKE